MLDSDTKSDSGSDTSSVDSVDSVGYPREKGVTVKDLLTVLQELVKKNPKAKSMPVYHVEFGGLVRVQLVEISTKINDIKVQPFLVLE